MVQAFIGGLLIGLAVLLMLLLNGRVTGVSGIVAASFDRLEGWRVAFLAGLMGGGSLIAFVAPQTLVSASDRGWKVIVVAGLLVGFGTVLGGGCTSGHGVCGMSRLSKRSIVATAIFMAFGILTARIACAF